MSETKFEITLKKSLFLICFKNCNNSVQFNASAITTDSSISPQFYDAQRDYWV